VVCKDPAGNPDPKKTCVNGACVTTCDCLPCSAASGLACQPSSGKCIDPLCVSVSCGPGDNCVAGNCVDACLNTVCPSNQQCTSGKCVDIIDTTPGGGADLGSDPVNGGAVATGCGCRLSPAEGSAPLGALAAATLLLAFALHRRRRQSSQPN
jgi:MYXO-CTERM domain-containing protein